MPFLSSLDNFGDDNFEIAHERHANFKLGMSDVVPPLVAVVAHVYSSQT